MRSFLAMALTLGVLTATSAGGEVRKWTARTGDFSTEAELVDVDEQVDGIFRETLRKLKDAGAELVEADLGGDFLALANRITWPIFFHDTMPAIREFLAINGVPVSFEEIFSALGAHIQEGW
jgi:mandelamide amidase